MWLSRDFNIFFVNIFDTFTAAQTINLPYKSLQFLAKHFLNIHIDKTYQTSDWTLRPINEAMKKYA